VGALTRLGLVVLAVAAAAVAAILLLGRGEAPPALGATAPLVVRAGFDPPTATFGDRVVARVVVLLDRSSVRAGTLKLTADVAPLTQLAAPRTTRTNRGSVTVVTYEVPAACLTDGCVATSGDLPLHLPRVTATVATHRGGVVTKVVAWPVLHVHGRVNAADLAGSSPRFRGDATPAPPTYRMAPSTLAALLDVLAVLLVLAGVAVAAYEARRLLQRRRRDRAADGGELERALRLAHEAESRPPPDRRRALGLLARLLDGRNGKLAREASELAWAQPQPEREAMSGLVMEIEQEVPS
jgi:hypothetical protein